MPASPTRTPTGSRTTLTPTARPTIINASPPTRAMTPATAIPPPRRPARTRPFLPFPPVPPPLAPGDSRGACRERHEFSQRPRRGFRGLVALGGVLGQETVHHPLQPGGERGVKLVEGPRRFCGVADQLGDGARVRERRLPGQA